MIATIIISELMALFIGGVIIWHGFYKNRYLPIFIGSFLISLITGFNVSFVMIKWFL